MGKGDAPKVDPRDHVALDVWVETLCNFMVEIRALAFDAAAPKGQRKHSRAYLRKTLSRRFKAIDGHVNGLSMGNTDVQYPGAPEAPKGTG